MATHSGTFAWKIPWSEEPGALQSMGLKIVRRYKAHTHMHWLGCWHPSTSGSVVKNPPEMQETQETRVQSLGREDLLEEEMATHSSILAWRIPWTEEPGGLSPQGHK